jgi:GTPase SAR1 family protein
MDKPFEEDVKARLSKFLREDLCFFAWLCAVRVLPFLGANGNFDYWKNKKGDQRQKYMIALLRTIDTFVISTPSITDSDDASNDRLLINDPVCDNTAAFTLKVVDAAACAVASPTLEEIINYAFLAVELVVDNKQSSYLKSILLDDLTNIKYKKQLFKTNIALYGEIWGNFQSALRDLGCAYWGDWYAKVFAKSFKLDDDDHKEIKMRLSVPGEIVERGAANVARYVMALKEQGAIRLNEARVIILGNKGSGKTSLAKRLNDPTAQMPEVYESTEGVDVINWYVHGDFNLPDGGGVNVHVWDFAGHVITHAAHRCFMSERCLYILVVDGRTEGDNRVEYWLEQIRNYGGVDSPVLVLVNVRDKHCVDLPENTLRKEFSSIVAFYQVNIRTGGAPLVAFRQDVMELLRDKPLWKNQQISAPAYKVKEALRQKFIQGNNFITRNSFDQIAKDNGVKPEEHEQLLTDLHDLGVCLWYHEVDMCEFNTMVLNPSWISYGIYRLINWGLNIKKSILSISDFYEVFVGADKYKYPAEKAAFLFSLMKTYQLAFFKNTKEIFVPLLLPADRPKSELIPYFPFGERLRVEYTANYTLPPYTVARLAVLHSGELNQRSSWRFGALLEWKGTQALVEEDNRGRSITVSVMGLKKTEYISRLRESLNSIFNDYKNNRPELKYEVLLSNEQLTYVDTHLLSSADVTKFLLSEEQIIGNANAGQKLVIGLLPLVNPESTIRAYNLIINDRKLSIRQPEKNVIIGNKFTYEHSQHINVEFKKCAINLQSDMNYIVRTLYKNGYVHFANELIVVASVIDEIANAIPENVKMNSPEMETVKSSLQKRGLLRQLKTFFDDICNVNSELHKKVSKTRKDVETLRNLISKYNSMARWLGLPQIQQSVFGEYNLSGENVDA